MPIHNYVKNAPHYVYLLLVTFVVNGIIYFTNRPDPLTVTQDGLRIVLSLILAALFLVSSVHAMLSLEMTRKINKITKAELDNIIENIKNNTEKDIIKNIYDSFETYSGSLYIHEGYVGNDCLEIVITTVNYESFWSEVRPFTLHIKIDDNKIINTKYIADKSFFTQ